jgi:hypothetical protein
VAVPNPNMPNENVPNVIMAISNVPIANVPNYNMSKCQIVAVLKCQTHKLSNNQIVDIKKTTQLGCSFLVTNIPLGMYLFRLGAHF